MARILVSGHINLETTVRIDGFPLLYNPVNYPFDGVQSRVAGVGFNIARALRTLGHDARLVSIIGTDEVGQLVRSTLRLDGILDDVVLAAMPETAQSVILYDPQGRRQIHTDLKSVQDCVIPADVLEAALDGVNAVVACNINYSRPLLALARAQGIPVVTDLHAICDLSNPYDTDFLQGAEIVFFSHERLSAPMESMVSQLFSSYPVRWVVVGMGDRGASLASRGGSIRHVPAVRTRQIVSTIGAGDALLSGFVHGFVSGLEPLAALERGVVFASWKIGVAGAAEGFLKADALEQLSQTVRI
jgi:sugar/nucleoside kinase (ribokinase family)